MSASVMPAMYAEVGGASYWAGAVVPDLWVGMATKYAALQRLATMRPGEQRVHALRSASRAWPGALREAELAGPELCRARWGLARARVGWPVSRRARWRDSPAMPVLLWADLHRLLADQLDFRRARGRADASALVAALPPPAQPRWPDAGALATLAGDRVRPRQAYLWLAAWAGLSLPELNRLLFGREGHWDRRPDDPAWAQIG